MDLGHMNVKTRTSEKQRMKKSPRANIYPKCTKPESPKTPPAKHEPKKKVSKKETKSKRNRVMHKVYVNWRFSKRCSSSKMMDVFGSFFLSCQWVAITHLLRVDLNPSKKKFTGFLVRNVRIDFPTLLKIGTKNFRFVFSYLLHYCNLCKDPQDMRKFPQKCQKIAGC